MTYAIPAGGASDACLDELSKKADNLVDYLQFSDYKIRVKNQVEEVVMATLKTLTLN